MLFFPLSGSTTARFAVHSWTCMPCTDGHATQCCSRPVAAANGAEAAPCLPGTLTSCPPCLQAWAAATDLFTGAELAALCREASMAALREDIHGAQHVAARHFAQSRAAIQPGLTAAALQKMAAWSPAGS